MRAPARLLWAFVALAYSFGVITLAASMWPICK